MVSQTVRKRLYPKRRFGDAVRGLAWFGLSKDPVEITVVVRPHPQSRNRVDRLCGAPDIRQIEEAWARSRQHPIRRGLLVEVVPKVRKHYGGLPVLRGRHG